MAPSMQMRGETLSILQKFNSHLRILHIGSYVDSKLKTDGVDATMINCRTEEFFLVITDVYYLSS